MKLFLIGGFLGSGKTTAIANACEQLYKKNIPVAVITNDQGEQQVDSYFIKSFSVAVGEVANGCFCCNFDDLVDNMQSLIKNVNPEIIFAESVGSCTDLIATVLKPLKKAYPYLNVVVIIFVDSVLLSLFLEGKSDFLADNVKYIFDKQIEEADILIANKADMVSPGRASIVKTALCSLFPDKQILYQNSFNEQDIENWLSIINNYQQPAYRQSLELDYKLYGDGESQLAWFDKSITLKTRQGNAIEICKKIILEIEKKIRNENLTIGHLKFFLDTGKYQVKISFTTSSKASFVDLPDYETNELMMIINARVQTEPQILSQIIETAIEEISNGYECAITTKQTASFKPGYPAPAHRIPD